MAEVFVVKPTNDDESGASLKIKNGVVFLTRVIVKRMTSANSGMELPNTLSSSPVIDFAISHLDSPSVSDKLFAERCIRVTVTRWPSGLC